MKFIHLADLHLGKRVNGFSMIEDQRYILQEILQIVEAERPQAVLIAGDVYDKSVPSAEAVELFDWFLVQLSRKNLEVFVIAGNHDSPERLAFGGKLMAGSGVHMSPVYQGEISCVTLSDEFGPVKFHMLPYLKPALVRQIWPEETIETYTDAVRTALAHSEFCSSDRNVLLAHQFVTGGIRSDSEVLSVGGTDQVDSEVFAEFDYVALGHLHGPQKAGSECIRYAGSPLKYSFSEACQKKSVTIAELFEKGLVVVRQIPLTPQRDLVELKGSYDFLTLRETVLSGGHLNDYVHITLTDEEDVPNAVNRLKVLYPGLMKLDYDNQRTRGSVQLLDETSTEQTPMELVSAFFIRQNKKDMSEQQLSYLRTVMETIWEEME